MQLTMNEDIGHIHIYIYIIYTVTGFTVLDIVMVRAMMRFREEKIRNHKLYVPQLHVQQYSICQHIPKAKFGFLLDFPCH